MVNQGNLLAMISAVNVQFGMVYPDGGGFSYIGYLPLAHILERMWGVEEGQVCATRAHRGGNSFL